MLPPTSLHVASGSFQPGYIRFGCCSYTTVRWQRHLTTSPGEGAALGINLQLCKAQPTSSQHVSAIGGVHLSVGECLRDQAARMGLQVNSSQHLWVWAQASGQALSKCPAEPSH
jgi:hypothetical protein